MNKNPWEHKRDVVLLISSGLWWGLALSTNQKMAEKNSTPWTHGRAVASSRNGLTPLGSTTTTHYLYPRCGRDAAGYARSGLTQSELESYGWALLRRRHGGRQSVADRQLSGRPQVSGGMAGEGADSKWRGATGDAASTTITTASAVSTPEPRRRRIGLELADTVLQLGGPSTDILRTTSDQHHERAPWNRACRLINPAFFLSRPVELPCQPRG